MERNVLRLACREIASPVAYCALSCRTGTRDEDSFYGGLAHLTEHMLFKGTLHRGSAGIDNVLERVGGELNAYTTKEETVLHATVLKEDLPKAADLLLELAFTSVFPQKELEKELEVIYDEIKSYKDLPAEAIYDEFEELLFAPHPLARPILGEKKTLRRITPEVLQEYLERRFVPENLCFTAAADEKPERVAALLRKSLKKYCRADVQVRICREETIAPGETGVSEAERPYPERLDPERGCLRKGAPLQDGNRFYTEKRRSSHQAHCILGCTAYSLYEKERIALAVLCNMLGGPASGSRLNRTLREKYGLVYTVEANYTPYSDTGIFTVYFGCDKEDTERCISLIRREINRISSELLSDNALKRARKQLLGQLSIGRDNAEARALSMGKSLLVYGRIQSFEGLRAEVEALTPEELLRVAGEVFRPERFSVLIYR